MTRKQLTRFKIILIFILFYNISFSQDCVKLYIDEHIYGSPICKLSKGDYIEICEESRMVNGCPRDFYIYKQGWSNGLLTYKLSLDRGWSVHYMDLAVNTDNQQLGFELQGQTAIYSYVTEDQMKKIQAQRAIERKREELLRIESNKIEDENTKLKITKAIEDREYFKANYLLKSLHFFDEKIQNRVNIYWLPIEKKMDSLYSDYLNNLDNFNIARSKVYSEYFKDKKTYIEKNKSIIKWIDFEWKGIEDIDEFLSKSNDKKALDEIKKAKSKKLFYYQKKYKEQLICPLSFEMLDVNSDKFKDVKEIEIDFELDTNTMLYLAKIKLKNKDNKIMKGLIVNPTSFKVPVIELPFEGEMKRLVDEAIAEGGKDFIYQKYYEKKTVMLDSENKISVNLERKRDYNAFRFYEETIAKYIDFKDRGSFYLNPVVGLLLKKCYPSAKYFAIYRMDERLGFQPHRHKDKFNIYCSEDFIEGNMDKRYCIFPIIDTSIINFKEKKLKPFYDGELNYIRIYDSTNILSDKNTDSLNFLDNNHENYLNNFSTLNQSYDLKIDLHNVDFLMDNEIVLPIFNLDHQKRVKGFFIRKETYARSANDLTIKNILMIKYEDYDNIPKCFKSNLTTLGKYLELLHEAQLSTKQRKKEKLIIKSNKILQEFKSCDSMK